MNLDFPASRGLSRRGKNERKERFLLFLPRRERPLLAGKTWIWLIEIQLQKSSLAFDKVSELE